MALSASANRQSKGLGRRRVFPVATGVTIYKGALVSVTATGYATPAADTASTFVVGVAAETVVNAGADGAVNVSVEYDREYLFAATSITQAMMGDIMVVVDDDEVDDIAGATNDIEAGKMSEFVSTTSCWVHVKGLTD